MDLTHIGNVDVLNELFKWMPADQRAILCSVSGDPSTVAGNAWDGVPWATGARCPLLLTRNNYVAVSSFGREDQQWRRRKAQFGALYALMVDDVGTKVPVTALPRALPPNGIAPSMVVCTSPNNYQVTYFLETPVTNQDQAEEAIRQIIAKLTGGGLDPGMSGVTRVLRLPQGINGKVKYRNAQGEPFQCRLEAWRPDIRVRWTDLLIAFGVLEKERRFAEPMDAVAYERKRSFNLVMEGLVALRIIKRSGRGWVDVRCPWVKNHTDRADTGAAVAYPAKENGYFGGYRCHHGHCQDRNWGSLEDWVYDTVAAEGQQRLGNFEGTGKP